MCGSRKSDEPREPEDKAVPPASPAAFLAQDRAAVVDPVIGGLRPELPQSGIY